MTLSDKYVEINKLREEWDSLQPISDENSRKLWKKFRLEWNYNSNHIEGNTLTYGETTLLLINGKTTGDHEKREYDEMQAHDVAIHIIKEWAEDKKRELSESDIRTLNTTILVQPFWKEAITQDGQATRRLIKVGSYKEYPNSVRLKTGELFHYASPEQTPILMGELMNWYRNNDIKHPLLLATDLHYKFIRIHPFDDGNGRIARLLVNYELMRNGYPPIIIKSADKENYLTALQKADAGDRTAFSEYMADQLIWSLQLAIKAARGEEIEEQHDWEKELHLLKKKLNSSNTNLLSKSESVILETWDKSIFPLFNSLIAKLGEFNELFAKFKIYGYIDDIGYEIKSAKQFENTFRTSQKNFRKLSLNFVLEGYKHNGINTFSIHENCYVEFADYKYLVKINHGQAAILEKLYSYVLTNEDHIKVIDSLGKSILKRIEQSIRS